MKFVVALLGVLGGLLLATGLVLFAIDLRFFARATLTEGEVIEIRRKEDGLGAPIVLYFDARGLTHVHRSEFYSKPSYRLHERVPIAYDPDSPGSAVIDSWLPRWMLPMFLAGFGSIFFFGGVGAVRHRLRRKREIAGLLRDGQRIDATILKAVHDITRGRDNNHPYVLHCQATLPGASKPRTFISRRFWYDPTGDLGPTVPVCYDPRDPSRHVVDTGDLPLRRR